MAIFHTNSGCVSFLLHLYGATSFKKVFFNDLFSFFSYFILFNKTLCCMQISLIASAKRWGRSYYLVWWVALHRSRRAIHMFSRWLARPTWRRWFHPQFKFRLRIDDHVELIDKTLAQSLTLTPKKKHPVVVLLFPARIPHFLRMMILYFFSFSFFFFRRVLGHGNGFLSSTRRRRRENGHANGPDSPKRRQPQDTHTHTTVIFLSLSFCRREK